MTAPSPTMPPAIRGVFDPLHKQTIETYRRWSLFQQAYDTSKERVELLNRHGGKWFGYAQMAMYDDIVLALFHLMDPAEQGGKKPRQNLTLERLANVLRENGQAQLSATVLTHLGQIKSLFQSHQDWRNKRTAHNDLSRMRAFWGGNDTSSGPSYLSIKKVLTEVAGCLNAVAMAYGIGGLQYDMFIHTLGQDGDELIRTLERYEQEREALKEDAPLPEMREAWPNLPPRVRKTIRQSRES